MESGLKKQLLTGKQIKKTSLDKYLLFDSYLHKIIIDILIDSINFWDNPKYEFELRKHEFKGKPIDRETVKYISRVLHVVYLRNQAKIIRNEERTKKNKNN